MTVGDIQTKLKYLKEANSFLLIMELSKVQERRLT